MALGFSPPSGAAARLATRQIMERRGESNGARHDAGGGGVEWSFESGLLAADGDLDQAGSGELTRGERELDGLALAGGERHAPEAFERAHGNGPRIADGLHVELDDFFARDGAGVLDLDGHLHRPSRARLLGQGQVAVGKRGIAQAVTKREEGLALE